MANFHKFFSFFLNDSRIKKIYDTRIQCSHVRGLIETDHIVCICHYVKFFYSHEHDFMLLQTTVIK